MKAKLSVKTGVKTVPTKGRKKCASPGTMRHSRIHLSPISQKTNENISPKHRFDIEPKGVNLSIEEEFIREIEEITILKRLLREKYLLQFKDHLDKIADSAVDIQKVVRGNQGRAKMLRLKHASENMHLDLDIHFEYSEERNLFSPAFSVISDVVQSPTPFLVDEDPSCLAAEASILSSDEMEQSLVSREDLKDIEGDIAEEEKEQNVLKYIEDDMAEEYKEEKEQNELKVVEEDIDEDFLDDLKEEKAVGDSTGDDRLECSYSYDKKEVEQTAYSYTTPTYENNYEAKYNMTDTKNHEILKETIEQEYKNTERSDTFENNIPTIQKGIAVDNPTIQQMNYHDDEEEDDCLNDLFDFAIKIKEHPVESEDKVSAEEKLDHREFSPPVFFQAEGSVEEEVHEEVRSFESEIAQFKTPFQDNDEVYDEDFDDLDEIEL